MWFASLFFYNNSRHISLVHYPKNDDRHTRIHVNAVLSEDDVYKANVKHIICVFPDFPQGVSISLNADLFIDCVFLRELSKHCYIEDKLFL